MYFSILLYIYYLLRLRYVSVVEEVSYVHQGCIYLMKITTILKQQYCEILLQFKIVISILYILIKIYQLFNLI